MIKCKSLPFQRCVEIMFLLFFSGIGLYARFPDFPQPYLWLDEAWRALAIISCDSPSQVISYMSKNSEFLLLSEWFIGKISIFLIPDKTFALRIIPLFFSLIASFFIFRLSKCLNNSYFSLLPLLLINGGYFFIFHAREFKPYSMDLCFSCALYYYAISFVNKNIIYELRDSVSTALLYLTITLFSLSSLSFAFIAPSIFLYFLYHKLPKSQLLPLILALTTPFFTNFFLYLSPQSLDGVQDFWSSYYINNDFSNIIFFAEAWSSFIHQSTSFSWLLISFSYFILLPALSLYKRDGIFLLFLTPFVVQVILSYLKIYPLFHRPSYYLYALAVISLSYTVPFLYNQVYILISKSLQSKISVTIKDTNLNGAFFQLLIFTIIVFSTLNSATFNQQINAGKTWPVDQGREILTILEEKYDDSDYLIANQASYFTLKYYASVQVKEKSMNLINFPLQSKLLNLNREDSIDDSNIESVTEFFSEFSPHFSRLWIASTHLHDATRIYISALNDKGKLTTYVDLPYQRLILFEPYPL